jgi:hypothetical protein
MAKFGGSKMYPRGPMIAHSASNCVADLPIGIDKDFFRSLVSMRTFAKKGRESQPIAASL